MRGAEQITRAENASEIFLSTSKKEKKKATTVRSKHKKGHAKHTHRLSASVRGAGTPLREGVSRL
jgi:hypothetical protein